MPKLPVRTARLELKDDYAGFWLEVNANPPMSVFEEFASENITRVIAAIATMTRASNLVDHNDDPVDLSTVEGWRKMPQGLLGEVASRLQEAFSAPKASATGSTTPSSPVADQSPTGTT